MCLASWPILLLKSLELSICRLQLMCNNINGDTDSSLGQEKISSWGQELFQGFSANADDDDF